MMARYFMGMTLLSIGFSVAVTSAPLISPATPAADKTRCVETDQIEAYKVENDKLVRFFLKNSQQMLLRLTHQCPQLYFHRYISYTPTDGKICAGADEIKTRAGLACRIGSLSPVPKATEVTIPQKPMPAKP